MTKDGKAIPNPDTKRTITVEDTPELLINRKSNTPFDLNPLDEPTGHTIYFGPVGAGKTSNMSDFLAKQKATSNSDN